MNHTNNSDYWTLRLLLALLRRSFLTVWGSALKTLKDCSMLALEYKQALERIYWKRHKLLLNVKWLSDIIYLLLNLSEP